MGDIERPSTLTEEDRAQVRAIVRAARQLTPDELDALCETLAAIRADARPTP